MLLLVVGTVLVLGKPTITMEGMHVYLPTAILRKFLVLPIINVSMIVTPVPVAVYQTFALITQTQPPAMLPQSDVPGSRNRIHVSQSNVTLTKILALILPAINVIVEIMIAVLNAAAPCTLSPEQLKQQLRAMVLFVHL